jgi:hypothetical protein
MLSTKFAAAAILCLFVATNNTMLKLDEEFFNRFPSDMVAKIAVYTYPINDKDRDFADRFSTIHLNIEGILRTITWKIQNIPNISLACVNKRFKLGCTTVTNMHQQYRENFIRALYTIPTSTIAKEMNDYAYIDRNDKMSTLFLKHDSETIIFEHYLKLDPNYSYYGQSGNPHTILNNAILCSNQPYESVQFLLERGADPNLSDEVGYPLDCCFARFRFRDGFDFKSIAGLLVAYGASLDFLSHNHPHLTFRQHMKKHKLCIELITPQPTLLADKADNIRTQYLEYIFEQKKDERDACKCHCNCSCCQCVNCQIL